jgi:hypothetical protein
MDALEQELAAKQVELAAAEARLVERELDFATLLLEWRTFERRYLRQVGARLAEIDDLEAQIKEEQRRRNPSDWLSRRLALEARAKARESAGIIDNAVPPALSQAKPPEETVEPPENIKALYRAVAKRVHPDLSADDAERAGRTRAMADANRAYLDGSGTRLRAILDRWTSSTDVVFGDGAVAELTRTVRKINQANARLSVVGSAIVSLGRSDLTQLRLKALDGRLEGRDLLDELARSLDQHERALRQQSQAARTGAV